MGQKKRQWDGWMIRMIRMIPARWDGWKKIMLGWEKQRSEYVVNGVPAVQFGGLVEWWWFSAAKIGVRCRRTD
jgi:hypothetical protein